MKQVLIILAVALLVGGIVFWFRGEQVNAKWEAKYAKLLNQPPKVVYVDKFISLPPEKPKSRQLSTADSLEIFLVWDAKTPKEQNQFLGALLRTWEWESPFDFDVMEGLRLKGSVISSFNPLRLPEISGDPNGRAGESHVWISDLTLPPPHTVTNTIETVKRPFLEFGLSGYAGKSFEAWDEWYAGAEVAAYVNFDIVYFIPRAGIDSQRKPFVQLALEYRP